MEAIRRLVALCLSVVQSKTVRKGEDERPDMALASGTRGDANIVFFNEAADTAYEETTDDIEGGYRPCCWYENVQMGERRWMTVRRESIIGRTSSV